MKAATVIEGIGLIYGQVSQVQLAPSTEGICFVVNGTRIPATPTLAVDTQRGVTLMQDQQPLSIVEHFLAACAMTGHHQVEVTVTGSPELPLLDGSAEAWAQALDSALGVASPVQADHVVREPVLYQDPQGTYCLAMPSDTLKIDYLVDFDHPDLVKRWWRWTPESGSLREAVAPAQTFGFVSELPQLQAMGLAKGVTAENTLGLTEEGGYTRPLKLSDEPIRHKVLDLIGDLMLCGVPIQALRAHVVVCCGGHTSHIAFGKALRAALDQVS